jgi:hypothetical protein
LACKCKSGYVWDVMTLTCITDCTSNSAACMSCNFPEASGSAIALNSATAKQLTGSKTVLAAVKLSYTNYAAISSYQCPCVTGFSWDSVRLRCFDSNLV